MAKRTFACRTLRAFTFAGATWAGVAASPPQVGCIASVQSLPSVHPVGGRKSVHAVTPAADAHTARVQTATDPALMVPDRHAATSGTDTDQVIDSPWVHAVNEATSVHPASPLPNTHGAAGTDVHAATPARNTHAARPCCDH